MKKAKRKKFCACILGIMLGAVVCGSGVNAFDGPTHKYVTDTSLSFVNNEFKDFKNFYTDDVIEQLLIYCIKPDEDETEGAYKFHFYNPATERNFMGEKESALTRFMGHYRKAVRYYKADRNKDAFEELGRSIHFLEDLNTPVHTNYENVFDAGLKLRMHVEFEKRCVAVQEECTPSLDVKNIGYYIKNSLSEIGKSSAYLSADNFYSLENEIEPRDIIAKYSVKNAQKAVIGLLYRFFYEVRL